jgi:hypothetical protein
MQSVKVSSVRLRASDAISLSGSLHQCVSLRLIPISLASTIHDIQLAGIFGGRFVRPHCHGSRCGYMA